tara:strand:- start:4351 stop:7599 length:3249 start_codon:yes stop_codon:yes gene_type:complete
MALDPQITSLKASGTYRFEFDKSQVVNIPANQIRLVVGFSKKGPFNTPVFVPDTAFFKQVFGDIDRNLEKKDSFFHRSCLVALERGPILAMNLLNLDENDQVEYIQFATGATPGNVQVNTPKNGEYQGFYNRDRFFFPDSDAFLDNVSPAVNRDALSGASTNNLLDFVNLGQNAVSVFVKKAAAENVAGFDITVEEFYGSANIPGFLDKDSLISDFMVDVSVIEGNFGGDFSLANPYERFDADPLFQPYFDKSSGLLRKKVATDGSDTSITEFLNLPEVNEIARYTACLIPNFIDQLGNNLFIENLINRDTATTGLFVTVNEDLFSGDFLIDGVAGGIDLIGHNLEKSQPSTVNFLSYQGAIKSDVESCKEFSTPNTVEVSATDVVAVSTNASGDIEITVTGSAGETLYDALSAMTANTATTIGTYLKGAVSNEYVPVIGKQVLTGSVTISLSAVGGIVVGDFPVTVGDILTYLNPTDLDYIVHEWDGSAQTTKIVGAPASALYTQVSSGTFTDGDTAIYSYTNGGVTTDTQSFLVFDEATYGYIHETDTGIAISDPAYNLTIAKVSPYTDENYATPLGATDFTKFNIDTASPGTGGFLTSSGTFATANCLNVITLKGDLNLTVDILADSSDEPTLFPNQVLIAATEDEVVNGDVAVGRYLVHSDGDLSNPSRLTRINEVQGGKTTANYAAIPAGTTAILVTTQSEILVDTQNDGTTAGVKKVELYYPIDQWFDYLNVFKLDGFSLDPTKHVPDGTNDRQNDILNDTIGAGTNLFKALTDRDIINFRYLVDTFGNGIEANSKSVYTKLCSSRKNASAIINAPSARDFKKSTDPSFLDATKTLSTRFIAEGGDLSKNPTVRYSLPSIADGASFGFYFFPFVQVRDLGRNISVPPAAYVSNNFINKFENALPWSLVAGVRRGVLGGAGLVGLETNLDTSDRANIEPFGLNPIIFQSGTGPTIFANKTAQQNPTSALSSINVREVVIYIQDGIDAILKNYLFEFNTPQTRLEIVTLANNFLQTVQNDDGVFDFRNVMDETNNPPEVIDRNIGIIDTFIEPVRGMEILVQRTTILRTGAISSGNFQ